MIDSQRTIERSVSASGVSLHSGENVTLVLHPLEAGKGIQFKRVDLPKQPIIKAHVSQIGDLLRNTTLCNAEKVSVSTVEHVLSALHGMGIDNVLVELDGSEPPIFDGSAKRYVELLQEAGEKTLDAPREVFELPHPVAVSEGDRAMIAIPHEGLRITCTFADERGRFTQHFTVDLDRERYCLEISNARTFTFYEDIEGLIKQGKIKGGSLDSAIVIKEDKVLSKEPLRFENEFVRHKILDIVGDVFLLGCRLHAHIVAIMPGHALNARLTAALDALRRESRS